jgi:hypothetical protein
MVNVKRFFSMRLLELTSHPRSQFVQRTLIFFAAALEYGAPGPLPPPHTTPGSSSGRRTCDSLAVQFNTACTSAKPFTLQSSDTSSSAII